VVELRATVVELRAQVAELTATIVELRAQLDRNSSNSSKPPSTDSDVDRLMRQARKQSQRSVSGRRPGKQPGGKGFSLCDQTGSPDETIRHRPLPCGRCGDGLEEAPMVREARCQVFDLPEPTLIVIEHVAETRRCRCGHTTRAGFPVGVSAPVCWGPRTRALAVYLSVAQHVPTARTAELLGVLGAAVSVGFITSCVQRSANQLESWLIGSHVSSKGFLCLGIRGDESIQVGVRAIR
jgi:transposase